MVQPIERDNRVQDLVKTMSSVYAFLEDAKQLDKIASFEDTARRLLQQTTECGYFITDYARVESFGGC